MTPKYNEFQQTISENFTTQVHSDESQTQKKKIKINLAFLQYKKKTILKNENSTEEQVII